jgi:predicted Zn finger-like uncharacterized protein
MLTQCPHCQTLFRVGPDHLKAAAGQVRCCRCHQVFNALESLRESVDSASPSDELMAEEQPHENALETTTEPDQENLFEATEPSEWHDLQKPAPSDESQPPPSEQEQVNSEQLIEDILEQDDGLDPEPDYFAIDSESQMSELLDQDSSSILLPDSEEPTEHKGEQSEASTNNIIAFAPPETAEASTDQEETTKSSLSEMLEFEDSILKDAAIDEERGKPDYDSIPDYPLQEESQAEPFTIDEHALNFEADNSHKHRNKYRFIWLIGSLLLLLPLSGQLAWQFREGLIQHETGRQAIGLLCRITGCEVPVRRALDKIIIQGRNLSAHPDKPETLFLQLNILNTAAFDQPFPDLTLSLYNDKGNLIARRTFSADDYLPTEFSRRQLMPKAQSILVEMELVDPGKEVTGFSFDFY